MGKLKLEDKRADNHATNKVSHMKLEKMFTRATSPAPAPRKPGEQAAGMDEFDREAERDASALRRASKMRRNKRLIVEAARSKE
jgi:hypothetical protein